MLHLPSFCSLIASSFPRRHTMKKLQVLLVAAALCMTASAAFAQDAQPQGQGAGQGRGARMIAALLQGITLTTDQQTKVDSLSKKFAADRQAMMQDQSLDQDARRGKMREAMTKQSDEIKALLTDD